MQRGYIHCFLNRPKLAMEAFQRGMRLSPLDPLSYYFSGGLALAAFADGQYEETIEWADRSLREEETFLVALRVKLAASGLLERSEEGRQALRRLLELHPGLTVGSLRAYLSRFLQPEVVARYAEGLRKARLPEE